MSVDWVTCDLLDDFDNQADSHIQVLSPYMDGKLWQQFGARRQFSGQVVTVKCFEDNSRVKELLATDGQGKVLVVDGGGSMRCALMGDLIAASAVKNQWNGVIISGCVRDVDVLSTLDLGIYALAAIPQKSTRKGVGESQIHLTIGGVQITPNDYVYADNNGILISKTALI